MDCAVGDGYLTPNDTHKLEVNVTGQQFQEIYNALLVGAQLVHPDKWLELLMLWNAAAYCPPSFAGEEDDCYNYPPYAPFVDYHPMNPYYDAGEIPQGYLTPPFVLAGGPVYQAGDVIVDLASFPFVANWFTVINGLLPEIQIHTVGDGQIELDLLNVLQGGMVIVKVGSPPNILDIIGGIFAADITIIDTAIDVAIPPEDNLVINHEINIEVGAGVSQTTYITWIPVWDDAFPPFGLPLRFGGGVRNIGLCGFENAGSIVGIQDLRRNGEWLETFKDGVWTPKVDLHTWVQANPHIIQLRSDTDDNALEIAENDQTIDLHYQELQTERGRIDNLVNVEVPNLQSQITSNDTDIQTLFDSLLATNTIVNSNLANIQTLQALVASLNAQSGLKMRSYSGSVGGTQSTTSTTYEIVPNSNVQHIFTYPNALIIAVAAVFNSFSDGFTYLKVMADGNLSNIENRNLGQSRKTLYLSDFFSGLTVGQNVDLDLYFRTDATKTGKISTASFWQYTIIEFPDELTQGLDDPLVTFDAGGAPYTSGTLNTGTVQAGGSGGDCMRKDTFGASDRLQIKVDLGTVKQIDNVKFGLYVESAFPNVIWNIDVDGSSCGKGITPLDSTWQVWDTLNDLPAPCSYPLFGQVVTLTIQGSGAGLPFNSVRIDNIEILTS